MAGKSWLKCVLLSQIETLSVKNVRHYCGSGQQFTRHFHNNRYNSCSSGGTRASDEVEKFGLLSAEWWNKSGDFVVLKALNKLRIPLIRDSLLKDKHKQVIKPLKSFKILDVGCGGGLLSEPLARLGAEVTGIDVTEESIIASHAHAKYDADVSKNVRYLCSSVEELVEDHMEYFDAVIASEVIEHVNNQSIFVQSCSELIKPGGHLFLTTINRSLLSLVFAKYMAEYLLRIVPAGVHDWNKFVTTYELTDMLREQDMELINFYGMTYNPLLKTWSWCDSTAMNYACHAIKPNNPE